MPQYTPSSDRGSKKRTSTGKRLRFSVFQRDHFTCQYCGAQPPDVVLVADHIVPVAHGGETEIENLITACEACNQGKADRSLASRVIRPDADLLYLETQQEIAELGRYRRGLAEREAAVAEVIQALQVLWESASGLDWHPADFVMRQMFTRYGPDVTEAVVIDVAPKVAGGYVQDRGNSWVASMHAVARNIARDSEWEEEGE